ncbi:RagB/SusD family nutrient uptake outer membrane protein [Hymenobacter convexus]|uniref:RagB/SusD family nutrient uptake outer membrane protein n=1 Tax=Hymenobacter sp. CA1UV-4 TaxID=3063782 RepID=UPI0027136742|nr:RagB/SusD family nutrient uptake outer membrane protein [Hymenobacter sp. CA1UV-4]MDO7849965.1 RagB/SusD family nutrient uptake outer membrane protein [Hymenobacter sp. CA1UV-4]
MKKLLGLLLAGAALTTACKKDDFLEPRTSALTEDTVFSDSLRTFSFLNRVYADMGFSFSKGRWDSHGNTEEATDDAEYRYSGATQKAVVLYSGTLTPLNFPFPEFYDLPWANIRRCNLLLSKLPTTPLAQSTKNRLALEARFLRAYYYEQLLVVFGGMPLIGDKVYGIEDVINQPRDSYADCIAYLSSELDACAAGLPSRAAQSGPDYGRITSGAALGLKSRLLLEAASPLFNGGAETQDPTLAAIVSYPSYSVSRWQAAADAAQAVIASNQYALVEDNTTAPGNGFYALFLQRVNTEYILPFNRGGNRDMEGFYFPPTRGGAWNAMPTQNIVDAFPMKSGKAITDPTSGYSATNPYVNRDPRFYNTIIYNQSLLFLNGAMAPVNTYEGAASDGFDQTTSVTGYYGRKMCDATSSANTQRAWPLLRYAEILLNYAEAINETGQANLAVPKLIDLRRRAGIDAGVDGRYGIPTGLSQAQMRAFIQNERRIELAFEDHRWHDIRRWKIAMVTNNAYNSRMRIVRSGTSPNFTYTYNVVSSIRRHNFRPEMYLLPIPDGEIRKVPLMRQNPGW